VASSKQSVERIAIDEAEIEGLLAKASTALTPAELGKLRQVVETLQFVTNELDKKRVSVKRLQEMLFGSRSESQQSPRLRDLLSRAAAGSAAASDVDEQPTAGDEAATGAQDGASGQTDNAKPKAKGHGRRSAAEYTGGEHEHVTHPSIKPKDPCPKCPKGRMYKQKTPKVIVRLTGTAPIQAKVWSYDWFRCNACGYIANAPLPAAAGPPEKHDESVTSTIGTLRYGYGMPLNRLAKLQEGHGIPLPASTQWDLLDRSMDTLVPIFTELIRQAARGDVIYNDDTTARILELMPQRKAPLPTQKKSKASDGAERVGVFTTGIISTLGERKIALFLTGNNHAGENLGEVLAACEGVRGPLVQMSDGLSRNVSTYLPEGLALIHANCLTHGRRKYVEIADSFPDQCLHVIEQLAIVYKNDAKAHEEKMSPRERLTYHQQHSAEVMSDLKAWLHQQLDDKLVEPNSAFGEATQYMFKRWEQLTRFLAVAGAPLDNNICERALKKSIRHRKNSMFYKTLHGARVGDIYMSLIHTCELCGVNAFDYLKTVLARGERVAEDPKRWMPWTYDNAGAANVPSA
jgi:transposase